LARASPTIHQEVRDEEDIVVLRTAMKWAAAIAVGGLAVSACGSVQMGAAAITGSSRISSSTLTSEVADLNSAYAADKTKGISPQKPAGQEAQQVLTWLILFRVYDQMAAQHGISVTPAQAEAAQAQYKSQAAQSGVSLTQYLSAGGALPPDLQQQLFQASAIQTALAAKLDGGTAPTTSAGQSAIASELGHQQCLAAKSLGINVNPQYGEYDYSGYQVVAAPPTLAADPTPSASSTPAVLKPPC
jgi:hypothetical protein